MMMRLEIVRNDAFAPIPCDTCRGSMRFIGSEPHVLYRHTDVYTYRCVACERFQVVVVPLMSNDNDNLVTARG